jgi:hypothetical protein
VKGLFHEHAFLNRGRLWAWLLVLLPFTEAGDSRAGVINSGAAVAEYLGNFTPRDSPTISDDSVVTARVTAAPSGAPATQHPGVDLWVRERDAFFVVRVQFGDRGDGSNSCLSFYECHDTRELASGYRVATPLAQELLAYLRHRDYAVGKFTSWGIPVLPWGAHGSNCGDACVAVLDRLGIAGEALPEMRQWIRAQNKGKWAFDRGHRRPTDEFFLKPPVNRAVPVPSLASAAALRQGP